MLNPATMMISARGQLLPKMYPKPSRSAPKRRHRLAPGGRLHPHEQQPHHHGEIARRVEVEARRQPHRRDQRAGDGRPDDARHVEGAGVERDGVHQVGLAHDLAHHRLPGGDLERGEQAVEGRETHDPVHRDQPEVREHRECQGLEQHEALEREHGAALVHPVGHHAAVEREQEDRERAEGGHQADGKGRIGELEDQPAACNGLHPGAALRHQLAGEKETEVPMSEG